MRFEDMSPEEASRLVDLIDAASAGNARGFATAAVAMFVANNPAHAVLAPLAIEALAGSLTGQGSVAQRLFGWLKFW
jgi:hypothetical protein